MKKEEQKIEDAAQDDPIAALRAAHEREIRGYEERLRACAVSYAMDALLEKSGAKNPEILKKLLDLDRISLDDTGKPILDEVRGTLDALRKSDGYLFQDEKREKLQDAGRMQYREPMEPDLEQMSDKAYYLYRRKHG